LPATGTSEATAVVCLAKSGDHFPFDEFPTMGTLGAEEVLVIFSAEIIAIFAEESSLR